MAFKVIEFQISINLQWENRFQFKFGLCFFLQFVTFAVLIAVANAGLLPAGPAVYHAQPAAYIQQRYVQPAPVVHQIATPVLAKQAEEYDPNPQYSFSYDIHVSHQSFFFSIPDLDKLFIRKIMLYRTHWLVMPRTNKKPVQEMLSKVATHSLMLTVTAEP